MTIEEKLNYILENQAKGVPLEEIAEGLDLTSKAVRSFMGRQGYVSKKGVFHKKQEESSQLQLTLGTDMNVDSDINTKEKKNSKSNKSKVSTETDEELDNITKFVFAAMKSEQRGVLKLTSEFDDILREMLDWYHSVKDLPQLKPKISRKTKTVILDEELSKETTTKRFHIDTECLENLTTISENTGIDINLLISQSIKDFLKTYKHLY